MSEQLRLVSLEGLPKLTGQRCWSCDTFKPWEAFSRASKERLGRKHHCKDCIANNAAAYRKSTKFASRSSDRSEHLTRRGDKICPGCKRLLSVDSFASSARQLDRKQAHCRSCMEARRRASALNNPAKALFLTARKRARKHGHPFAITIADVCVPECCPVLGIPLVVAEGRFTDNSPTLDRIKNSEGYVRGNVRVISYRANRIKSNVEDAAEFEAVVAYMRGMP
jgi:hypothetical protein